jgi:iron complex outermembrane receptor protein
MSAVCQIANAAEAPAEIQVIGITPGGLNRQDLRKVPHAVYGAGHEELNASESLDLSDYMNSRLPSVTINSAQNNPLQPDVNFRGFTISPLLGLSQGLSVYQNGARINEPLGDAVNWDLLPESAIYSMELMSGSNPVFGLNTLGGALSVIMKNGFNYTGNQLELTSGSWNRVTGNLESGANNGKVGYYANLSYFDEDGWRDLSASDALNGYVSASWRDADRSSLNVGLQSGSSNLIGNGALPAGLLESRSSVFTAPDITENELLSFMLDGSHRFSDTLSISGNLNWRRNKTHSFNGDASEYELCEFSGGGQALFEESDELEDLLIDQLDIELDDICAGEDDAIASLAALEALIAERAAAAGLDPEDFELDDISDSISGTGVLADDAINNMSDRAQHSRSFDLQLEWTADLFGRSNQFVSGFGYFDGETGFHSRLELAGLDPLTRSTMGLGTGAFVDTANTDIETITRTWSVYFTNTLDLTDELSLTVAGRYNDTDVVLRDQSGIRPELNGDHNYTRFNPSAGLAWNPHPDVTWYASYSISSRVPTPIELACNEHIFLLARQFAEERGEDPEDIDFECRLPNAFLADPYLEDVVTRTLEIGVRGQIFGLNYQAGMFSSDNRNDIIFQTTGRATGLFANVDDTLRQGVEFTLSGQWQKLDWMAGFTHVKATFEDEFKVLSPNHPQADGSGSLMVSSGSYIPGLPQNILKLGADYYFTDRLSLGLDAMHNSSQYLRGDEANCLDKVDGFTLLNLRASFTLGDRLEVFARVTNVLDENYENFGLIGEDPTEVLPTLTDARPYFLGVGAPRAGWLGMRLQF